MREGVLLNLKRSRTLGAFVAYRMRPAVNCGMPEVLPPSGTITFLFTDIEGSAKLWEAYPLEMASALARHDAILREAVQEADGYVFKTVGDSCCAAFATASDALAAALAAQLSIVREPWPENVAIKVRMGLHTGAAESRDGDYFGPALNRSARLMAIAYGGQVLLSQPTYDLVQDDVPEACKLESLGEHRLKDLGRPETVFQLLHPDLPIGFHPLRSLGNPELPNNLPLQVTSLVGREKEVAEVLRLMQETRLLTLTGSGGCGKTRLALQAAAEMLDGTGSGVWFFELAPLTDPALVPQTVAAVLGIKETPGKDPTRNLVDHLASKYILLVLDNCEHILAACAALADSLLHGCPRVLILATSREGLGIAGETTYRVPSLSLPDPNEPQTQENLARYESVRLFTERARQVETTFAVTDQNAGALASVCHRLDGIPLAIELAAARIRSLTLEDINARLDHRFRLLTGGSRTALPRQQTLRSLIDWSYDLLNESEKALLCRLSVFAGGFSLESAEQVCAGGPFEEPEVLDLLASLCDKSLVSAEPAGSTVRYRILETVRQYGRDRLLEGGDCELWRDRHLDHFLAFAEEAEQELTKQDQQSWFDRVEREHDNLRAALEWCNAPSIKAEYGLRVAVALWRFWLVHGYLCEGRDRIERALINGKRGDAEIRAKALNAAGNLTQQQGDYEAARALYQESLAIFSELGDRRRIAGSLVNLGNLAKAQGKYPAARDLYEEGLVIFRELGHRSGIAASLGNLGIVAYEQGEYPASRALHEEALSISLEEGHRWGIANMSCNLGNVLYQQGEFTAALTLQLESLATRYELGDRLGIQDSMQSLALLASTLGNSDLAARIWGFAERLREELCAPLPPNEIPSYEERIEAAQKASGDVGAFDRAWQVGREMNLDHLMETAIAGLSALAVQASVGPVIEKDSVE